MHFVGKTLKMKTEWVDDKTPIQYQFRLSENEIPFNEFIGKEISIKHTGDIHCINCDLKIKKTFAQGYCYPCFTTLAETDMCIMKPHECHHHLGTCRDNEFAEKHCFIPHLVYLAISSGAKVGITREYQKLTRWADQGASYAMELAVVPNRKISGELEIVLSNHISDKTNWRKMLSGNIPEIQDHLMGIKGQYLIFEKKVVNIRKYQGYVLELDI